MHEPIALILLKGLSMNEMELLLGNVAKHWGWHVGNKVKQELESVIGAQDVDIQQLQSAIQTIQGLLDADPGTPEFDVGQNIVTQLTDHLARITGLESDVATLKGDENTVGSVAYSVKQERDRALGAETALQAGIDANSADIATLNGDETVDGSVAKAVKTATDAEAAAREAADANLQAQIDNLSGGGSGSISSLQSEVDAIEAATGLNADGGYTADSATNYISDATSLTDADKKLDAAIKAVDDARIADKADGDAAVAAAQAKADANEAAISTLNGDETVDGSVAKTAQDAASAAGAAAVATAKTYADDTFVKKADVAAISVDTLASMFRSAMDCGFGGATIDDVLNGTGDCASGGTGGGDGAVI